MVANKNPLSFKATSSSCDRFSEFPRWSLTRASTVNEVRYSSISALSYIPLSSYLRLKPRTSLKTTICDGIALVYIIVVITNPISPRFCYYFFSSRCNAAILDFFKSCTISISISKLANSNPSSSSTISNKVKIYWGEMYQVSSFTSVRIMMMLTE